MFQSPFKSSARVDLRWARRVGIPVICRLSRQGLCPSKRSLCFLVGNCWKGIPFEFESRFSALDDVALPFLISSFFLRNILAYVFLYIFFFAETSGLRIKSRYLSPPLQA